MIEISVMKSKTDFRYIKCPFPIDLVYLWVDGNDPEFRKLKAKYLRAAGKDDSKYVDDSQDQLYCDNDELKYSLRSVVRFPSGWIRKIRV